MDLAVALRDAGHDVALLATSFVESAQPPGAVQLEARSPTRLGRYLHFLDSLDDHLDKVHYDIVHAMLPVRRCHVYHPHAGIAADSVVNGHLKYNGPLARGIARAANRLNRKRNRFAAVERNLLTGQRPPIVLSLSRYVEQAVRRHYSIDENRLRTLLNGVDLHRFDPSTRPQVGLDLRRRLGLVPEQVVALMIAQDFVRKGLRETILALARIPDERLILLVAGKPDPQSYRRLAERHGVAKRVFFAGPTSDPYSFYQAADCFVLPTRHDPCSLVVLEALGMGVPVISTVFNGACEAMTPDCHGIVLPDPADVEALAAAMRVMLDTGRRRAMSAACLALRPRLSYAHHVEELLKIYEAAR